MKYKTKEIEYLMQTYHYMDKQTIMKNLPGHSWRSVLDKANQLHLSRPNIRTSKLKILLEDTVLNAYWWGFIMADGHITNKGDLKIFLSIKDRNHLEKLAAYIKDVKIYDYGTMSHFSVMDKINGNFLKEKLNINSRKTYNPPDSFDFLKTEEQLLAFFIGFVDGDGNISFRSLKDGSKSFRSIRIVVHHNWYDFFKEYCSKLEQEFDLNFTINNTNKRGNTTVYLGTCASYNKLKDFINNNKLPILVRKWNK